MKLFWKVIEGDCFEVLPRLEPKSIDLICTDPPYNISSDFKLTKQKNKIKTTKEAWGSEFEDDISEPRYLKFMEEFLLKENGSILTFFDRSKPYLLKPFYKIFFFRNMIAFIKKNPTPHIRKNNYRSGFELCAWFSRKKYKINFLGQREMKNYFIGCSGIGLREREGRKVTEHPTEKMEWMIKPLIERHSAPGDVVLDPFLGSGTTMVVCKKLKRSCIGIEIKKKYCILARKRVSEIHTGSYIKKSIKEILF